MIALLSISPYIIVNMIGFFFNIYLFKWLVERLWISVILILVSIMLIALDKKAGITIAKFYLIDTMISEIIGVLIRQLKLNNLSDFNDMERKAEASYHYGVFIWIILWLVFFILMMKQYYKKTKKY